MLHNKALITLLVAGTTAGSLATAEFTRVSSPSILPPEPSLKRVVVASPLDGAQLDALLLSRLGRAGGDQESQCEQGVPHTSWTRMGGEFFLRILAGDRPCRVEAPTSHGPDRGSGCGGPGNGAVAG